MFGLAVIKATNIKKLHAGGRRSCLAHTHTHTPRPEKLKQLANKRKTNKKPLTSSSNNNNNEHIVKQKTQTWLAQIWSLPIMASV